MVSFSSLFLCALVKMPSVFTVTVTVSNVDGRQPTKPNIKKMVIKRLCAEYSFKVFPGSLCVFSFVIDCASPVFFYLYL